MAKPKNSDADRQRKALKEIAEALKNIEGALYDTSNSIREGAVTVAGALHPHPQLSRGFIIHVAAVELTQKESHMSSIDHMPPINLPASTLRALLKVVGSKKADGAYATGVTWTSSDETQVSIEAIADTNAQTPDPAWVDPNDGTTAPLIDLLDEAGNPVPVSSCYANTPLDTGTATVTVKAAGMTDADIVVSYADPAQGHFAIVASEASEA